MKTSNLTSLMNEMAAEAKAQVNAQSTQGSANREYNGHRINATALRDIRGSSTTPKVSWYVNGKRTAAAKVAALVADAPLDPPGYAARVAELVAEGMSNSDAQAVADAELG